MALAPIFVLMNGERVDGVGTDPAFLAALGGDAEIDAVALFEDLAFGFRMRHRTIFSNVHRLLDGEYVSSDSEKVTSAESPDFPSDTEDAQIADLSDAVEEMFERGDALELTGGIDSRLVLALGLHRGKRPRLAITLGEEGDPDVRAARALCDHFCISHLVLPVVIDPNRLAEDVQMFVRRSGYFSNGTAYGWLPAVFRRLADERRGQITGTGGECATGFYYTPADPFLDRVPMVDLWIRWRLQIPGNRARELFCDDIASSLGTLAAEDARLSLTRGALSWRARLDRFYCEERIRQWAAPVLMASGHWYEVSSPLLSNAYQRWAASRTPRERAGRKAQRELIARLHPDLAALPYAAAFNTSRPGGLLRKMTRRFCNRRTTADLGARSVASALAKSPDALDCLERLCDHPSLGLSHLGVTSLLSEVSQGSQEIGALITASHALADARSLRQRLRDRRSISSSASTSVAIGSTTG